MPRGGPRYGRASGALAPVASTAEVTAAKIASASVAAEVAATRIPAGAEIGATSIRGHLLAGVPAGAAIAPAGSPIIPAADRRTTPSIAPAATKKAAELQPVQCRKPVLPGGS